MTGAHFQLFLSAYTGPYTQSPVLAKSSFARWSFVYSYLGTLLRPCETIPYEKFTLIRSRRVPTVTVTGLGVPGEPRLRVIVLLQPTGSANSKENYKLKFFFRCRQLTPEFLSDLTSDRHGNLFHESEIRVISSN